MYLDCNKYIVMIMITVQNVRTVGHNFSLEVKIWVGSYFPVQEHLFYDGTDE